MDAMPRRSNTSAPRTESVASNPPQAYNRFSLASRLVRRCISVRPWESHFWKREAIMKPLRRFSLALLLVLFLTLPLNAQVSTGSLSLGSVSLGATASTTVTLTLPAAAILGSIQVLTQGAPGLDYTLASGGSCTPGNSYAANDTCTVEAEFAPRYPGVRSGAVILFDNSGNVLATVYLMGIGSGPQTTFSAGSERSIVNNLFLPSILLDQN